VLVRRTPRVSKAVVGCESLIKLSHPVKVSEESNRKWVMMMMI